MKNQKGFVVPLLLAIIAVLVIGGGIYISSIKKSEAPVFPTSTDVQTTNQVQQQTNTQPSQPAQTQPVASLSNAAGFRASPLTGSKPLSVTFSFPRPLDWPEAGTVSGTMYQTKLYYGDGGSDFVIPGDCHACGGQHTYATSGTYTAKLTKYNNYPNGSEVLIGTATVVVK